jgi:acyl-CoA hydrolase
MFTLDLEEKESLKALAKKMDEVEISVFRGVNVSNEPIVIKRNKDSMEIETFKGSNGSETKTVSLID